MKYKIEGLCRKYKFGTGAVKYKLGPRAGAEPGDQGQGRERETQIPNLWNKHGTSYENVSKGICVSQPPALALAPRPDLNLYSTATAPIYI